MDVAESLEIIRKSFARVQTHVKSTVSLATHSNYTLHPRDPLADSKRSKGLVDVVYEIERIIIYFFKLKTGMNELMRFRFFFMKIIKFYFIIQAVQNTFNYTIYKSKCLNNII